MSRPKLRFNETPDGRSEAAAAPAAAGYRIYSTYRRNGCGEYTGDLKVVRVPDGRMIYPFDGAPGIGPYPVAQAAREAAAELGAKLVEADRQNPEL
jgi:hypothetical protein